MVFGVGIEKEQKINGWLFEVQLAADSCSAVFKTNGSSADASDFRFLS